MTKVRNCYIFLLALLVHPAVTKAQTSLSDVLKNMHKQGVTVYFEGAVNRSFPAADPYGSLWFPGAGLGAYKSYTSGIGWKISLEYNGLKYEQTYRNLSQLTTRTITESYLDVPLSFMLRLDKNNPDLAVELGFIPSLYLGSAVSIADTVPTNASTGVAANRNAVDFSAAAMAGIALPISKYFHFTFQYRYPVPFSYISDNEVMRRPPSLRFGIRVPINRGTTKVKTTNAPSIIPQTSDLEFYVRLNDNSKQIKALREAGLETDAAELRVKTFEKNQRIAAAFIEKLEIGKAYFFASSQTAVAIDSIWELNFLNPQTLDPDTSLQPYRSNYFFAEFSTIPMEEFGKRSAEGLVVYDRQLNVLKEPFPYYTPSQSGVRTPPEVVNVFSRRLRQYLQKQGISE